MSMMFGKVKTYNAAAAPDQSPAECNLVLLGVMGSGKSGPTFLVSICFCHTTSKQNIGFLFKINAKKQNKTVCYVFLSNFYQRREVLQTETFLQKVSM